MGSDEPTAPSSRTAAAAAAPPQTTTSPAGAPGVPGPSNRSEPSDAPNKKTDTDPQADVEEFGPEDQQVDVLFLVFEYSDIEGLGKERRMIRDAFETKGLQVRKVTIDMQNPWDGWSGLDSKLRKFLSGEGGSRVIYYHGYSGEPGDSKLEFVR